ncbi:UDP-N-acetylglucosamine transferase subunit ALG13-like [Branchiostoma lanceolatum]|uniref:UDP-N-acetylglucosamine transferase subunit ALG13-like n=1 Tax=Branchiostoma lanceolatum TaxID=7740 RepID=UPI001132FDDD
MSDREKCVFVTVGTTSFDPLIELVSGGSFCKLLEDLGYARLLLQIGRGQYEPEGFVKPGFRLEYYRFKDTIAEDIQGASLVISHAGAGSCLETLGAGKPLVVVINETLMNNHQLELANQLYKDGHLYYATCSNLRHLLKDMDIGKLKTFPPGEPEKFAAFLDKVMGVS